MHCSNGLIRMKVVASEGTSRSFAVLCGRSVYVLRSQLTMGFVSLVSPPKDTGKAG